MGISSFGRSLTDNWELITTSSPSAASTVTLSSIETVYSKLLLTVSVTNTASITSLSLKINNSSTDYLSTSFTGFINTTYGYRTLNSTTSHILTDTGTQSITNHTALAVIYSANTLGGKYIESQGAIEGGGNACALTQGFWGGSAAIDRLDITGPSMTGTIKLYGVRA